MQALLIHAMNPEILMAGKTVSDFMHSNANTKNWKSTL